jgi:hypothetical protein
MPPARSSPRSLASSASRPAHRQPCRRQPVLQSPTTVPHPLPHASVDGIGMKPDLLAGPPCLLAPRSTRAGTPVARKWGNIAILALEVASVVLLSMLTDPVVRPFFRLVWCCFDSAWYNLL